MIVHFENQSGEKDQIECVAVHEGESGLHLMNATSKKMQFQIGYVPYERLNYAEPSPDEESE